MSKLKRLNISSIVLISAVKQKLAYLITRDIEIEGELRAERYRQWG